MKRAGWLLAALAVVAVVAWFAVRGRTAAAEYRLVPVERGDLTSVVSATGALQAVTSVEVGTQVSGQVSEILVDFNSRVKKGQLIARIDPTILQQAVRASSADLEKARAQAAQKKWAAERAETLYRGGLVPESDYRTATAEAATTQADLEAARVALDRARRNLGYTEIRSPIDGVVVERNVQAGQTVAASLQAPVLFRLAEDLSRLQILAAVDESDIGKIQAEQEVEFTVQAYPEEKFRGRVSQVRLQSTTTENVVSYGVVVDVDNPGLRLKPGMTATVEFIVARARGVLKVQNAALRVRPTEAMQAQLAALRQGGRAEGTRTGEGNRWRSRADGQRTRGTQPGGQGSAIVWVPEGKGVKPLRVRTGLTDGQETEIVSAELREGMDVVAGVIQQQSQSGSSPFQQQQNRGPGGPGGPGRVR
ncbi:MAG TPA: efflux RND transporter periplasmic adaptor subunit [Candidatus Polarisedimenticolaceae bacterium]|nr:efflux RND transporter periplasmic adaptor subunit [Candidatus Polarisedimenticolaceae bacterium]